MKTDLCDINGPWSNPREGNMQRVIRRIGMASPDKVNEIARTMYKELRYEDGRFVLQYVSVGRRRNEERQSQYPQLLQITWDDIATFLYERFSMFPEKLPDGRAVHMQWPDFGRFYGHWIREMNSEQQSRLLVWQYIDRGPQSFQ